MLKSVTSGWHIIAAAGVSLDVWSSGDGPPLLFLHSGEALELPSWEYLKQLARHFHVVAPRHPGFGKAKRPSDLRDVSDLAYLYLELVEQLFPQPPLLAGASFGGWIAAEMVIRSPRSFSGLVLISPVGLKAGGREEREIADIFAMTDEDLRKTAYADPTKGFIDTAALDDDLLTAFLRGRESLAYYAWDPYMHNPRLRRWLCRVRIPTLLLTGDQDRVVSDDYFTVFASALPDVVHQVIADAGHFPHHEQPERIANAVLQFWNCSASAASVREGAVA